MGSVASRNSIDRNTGGLRQNEDVTGLWTCPDCGREFAQPHQWHSCGVTSLEHHLSRARPEVRTVAAELFDLVGELAGTRLDPVKTGITLMTDRAFGFVSVRSRRLDLQLRFEGRRDLPGARRAERVSTNAWAYEFRLEQPADLDELLRRLIREAAEG